MQILRNATESAKRKEKSAEAVMIVPSGNVFQRDISRGSKVNPVFGL